MCDVKVPAQSPEKKRFCKRNTCKSVWSDVVFVPKPYQIMSTALSLQEIKHSVRRNVKDYIFLTCLISNRIQATGLESFH